MPFELTDVHVFDDNLAQTYKLTEDGFSSQDIQRLEMQAKDIIAGRVDVISITLADGVSYSTALSKLILAQIDEVLRQYCTKEPFACGKDGNNYNGLHVDAERNPEDFRKFLTEVELRIHCNSGQHELVNCPAEREPKDFEPFIIFGRVGNLFIYPDTLTQSYETFTPTLAVNLMQPSWNIFRAHGKHHPFSPNKPVAHAVIPRMLATDVLDPEAEFTELANGDFQQVTVNGRSQWITPHWKSPYAEKDGVDPGFVRELMIVNYPIHPSGVSSRSLVA